MTWSAGITMGCLGAAAAVIASAADALFLAHVGAAQFGIALALSSVVLVATLSWVGARADSAGGGGRGTLLQSACVLAALVAVGLSLAVGVDATLGAWLALLCGKQLTSSVDLLFWVMAARRLDARQNRRLVPIFVTAHGLGTVVGAFAVGPLAHALGSQAALAVGGSLFAAAAVASRRFARHRGAHAVALGSGRRASTQQSMLHVVRSSRMTRYLALVVAIAGVFAPLMYVLMGTTAQAELGDDAALTAFFGQYRGGVQLLTFAAQVFLAPRVLARAGVAVNLLLAPVGAVLGGLLLGISQSLALVVAAQAIVKLLDAAVQTPAEKLAQNLLPRQVRGRVAGFLDGVAKRAGAIIGGALAALLIDSPPATAAALVAVAGIWLIASLRMYRHFADMAVAELERSRIETGRSASAGAGHQQFEELESLADPRTIARLRAALSEPARQDLAIELMGRLADAALENNEQVVDIRAELAQAAAGSDGAELLLGALLERLHSVPNGPIAWERVLDRLGACVGPERSMLELTLAVRSLGLATAQFSSIGDERRARVVSQLRALATDDKRVGLGLVLNVAEERAQGGDPREVIERALDHGGSEERDVAFDELTAELSCELAVQARHRLVSASVEGREPAPLDELLPHTWGLLRALRRRARKRPDAGCARAGLAVERVIARCASAATSNAEVMLLRSQAYELARSWLEPDTPASLMLAGARLLAGMARADDATLLARALGHADGRVRSAAMAGLTRLGPAALDVLLATSRYARRRARLAAAAVLRELRVSTEALEAAIDAELTAIDRSTVHLAAFASLERASLLSRRLAERIHEATHALLAMLAARVDNAGVEVVGAHLTSAGPWAYIDRNEGTWSGSERAARAHALETLDTLLPRELAARVTAVLEDGSLRARARRAAARLGALENEEEPGGELQSDAPAGGEAGDMRPDGDFDRAIRRELALGDPLTSALVVQALDRAERAHHRQDIFAAANGFARSADPLAMLQRLTAAPMSTEGTNGAGAGAGAEEEDDMPRLVETVMQLHRVPLFAELTTRQLAELAEVVHWRSVRAGEVIVEQGQVGDAMYFVVSGRVQVTIERAPTSESSGAPPAEELGSLGPGEPFGEMALFEELPRSATVWAQEKVRIGRISRVDFESLVEDMPSIALAICRVLSRRVRIHNEGATQVESGPTG